MSRAADPTQQGAAPVTPVATPAQIIAASLRDKHVCPFCGTIKENPDGKCQRCTLEDTPAIRQATKARIGPWHVLQGRNPAAPGMRFATLLSFIQKGQVTARSIVRGPTTHQLWRFAARVKGLSREFGVCYGCGGDLKRADHLCPHCQRVQDPPSNPDVLLESWTSAPQAAGQNGESGQNGGAMGRTPDMIIPTLPGQRTAPAGDTAAARPHELAAAPAAHPAHAASAPAAAPAAHAAPTAAQGPSHVPLAAGRALHLPADTIIDPAQLADRLAVRLEPRGPRRMARSFGLFLLMTLVGVATWLLIDRDSWQAVSNWFSDSFAAVRSTYREPDVRPKSPPVTPPKGPVTPVTPPVTPPALPTTRRDPPETIVDPPDRAIEEARKLWREALECEGREDWAGAVAKYEAIKKLPPSAWPAPLDRYLSNARQHLR